MTPEQRASAYHAYVPRHLASAHLALVRRAEVRGWPEPQDVVDVARVFGVPAADLAPLVGLVSWREPGVGRSLWASELRGEVRPDVEAGLPLRQRLALRWFRATILAGWFGRKPSMLH